MTRSSTTLHLGDAAPDFALTDAVDDSRRSLAALLRDNRWLLVVFHRGMW